MEGEHRPVCCSGCQAVAQLIQASGLGGYYRFRQAMAIRADLDTQALASDWQSCDHRQDLWGEAQGDGRYELLLQAEGVRCAACAWLIRSRLEPLPGIDQVQVDPASGTVLRRARTSAVMSTTPRLSHRPIICWNVTSACHGPLVASVPSYIWANILPYMVKGLLTVRTC